MSLLLHVLQNILKDSSFLQCYHNQSILQQITFNPFYRNLFADVNAKVSCMSDNSEICFFFCENGN